MVTRFTSDSTVSFSVQCYFVSLASKAATAARMLLQIVIYFVRSIFLRQLVTQSSIATTSAGKAVASCPSDVFHCILL